MTRDSYHLREYTPVEVERHEVDNLVVTCADHRFQHAFAAIMRNLLIDRADRLSYPGPSNSIASGELLPAIVKLESLHSFTKVHVFDHIDCGAHGGQDAFDWDVIKEAEAHYQKQRQAIHAIHEVLPHLTVVTHVVSYEEEITRPEEPLAVRRYGSERND